MPFETDLDGEADANRIKFTVNDIGGETKVVLFGQFDDCDGIRNRHGGIEGLIVDRVRENRPMTGDRLCNQIAATVRAVRGRRMNPPGTPTATGDHEAPVGAALPECTVVFIALGDRSGRVGGWRVIGHDKESTFHSSAAKNGP